MNIQYRQWNRQHEMPVINNKSGLATDNHHRQKPNHNDYDLEAGDAYEPTSASRLGETERAVLWEVNLVRGCLESFKGIIGAQAIVLSLLVTVNLIGFLQPPKGYNNGSIDEHSASVKAFSVFNSLSLYTAISGLLFYIYCSYSTVFSLGSFMLPDRYDRRGVELLYLLRAALRRTALPSVRRRSKFLFLFLSLSLFFCVGAYISSGVAAMPKKKSVQFACVVAPAIPGCLLIMFMLHLSYTKLKKELDFETRIDIFWCEIARIDPPNIEPLETDLLDALDPVPTILCIFRVH